MCERLVDHSRLPVAVDRRLRIGAAVGLASLAAFTTTVIFGRHLASAGRPRFLLFGFGVIRDILWTPPWSIVAALLGSLCTLTGLVLLAATSGFARARRHHLTALFVLVLAGTLAAAPLLIAGWVVAANLAIWVALFVLIAAIGAFILFAVIAALAGG